MAKCRVLIVDDSLSTRDVLREMLNDYECAIIQAANGVYAMPYVRLVDIIILDICMPHMNGYEFMRKVRGMGVTTPIIAMSSADDPETAYEYGASLFLLKPINHEELIDGIERLLL